MVSDKMVKNMAECTLEHFVFRTPHHTMLSIAILIISTWLLISNDAEDCTYDKSKLPGTS